MKILVMGAGYTGMALLDELQKLNHEIYVTTMQQDKVESLKSFANHILVLPDAKGLKEIIDACDAMIVLVAPKNHQNYETTYLETAKCVLESLTNRLKPFYLLYTSSTSVYQGTHEEWVTENSPLKPQTANGKILLETEYTYLKYPNSCVLRLGGIYGPQRELIQRAQRLSGQEQSGNGKEATNHIHRDDIVAALLFCLEKQMKGIYNLTNDSHPSRNDLYTSLCESINISPPIWKDKDPREKGYKVSNEKIKKSGYIFNQTRLYASDK